MTKTSDPDSPKALLLIPHNDGEALLVIETLGNDAGDGYQVIHVTRLADALETIAATQFDVVLMDVGLPDCGVDAVRAIRDAAGDTPIVVLSDVSDRLLASGCVEAGAQDFVAKSATQGPELLRAIGHAMSRVREGQRRDMRSMIEDSRALSSRSHRSSVTAELAQSGAIATRSPERFKAMVGDYLGVLRTVVMPVGERLEVSRATMAKITTVIGDAGGGPRDLLDVHVAALELAASLGHGSRHGSLVIEARLLALQMMGLLVDYYRVGNRRSFSERPK